MIELYKIGELKPLAETEIKEIENLVSFSLPADYKAFLTTYGFGSINELVMMRQPDEEYINSNFSDCMDFWNLTETKIQLVLNSLTIATTIDGDIITVIDNYKTPVVVLPRHSDEPVYFENFENVLEYFTVQYNLKKDLYFDPVSNFEQEYISFVKNGSLDKALFDTVYEIFLEKVFFEKSYNIETQPKYIIQKMGGWVYFDAISKSAIRVKYQKQFKAEADKIIELINAEMKDK